MLPLTLSIESLWVPSRLLGWPKNPFFPSLLQFSLQRNRMVEVSLFLGVCSTLTLTRSLSFLTNSALVVYKCKWCSDAAFLPGDHPPTQDPNDTLKGLSRVTPGRLLLDSAPLFVLLLWTVEALIRIKDPLQPPVFESLISSWWHGLGSRWCKWGSRGEPLKVFNQPWVQPSL